MTRSMCRWLFSVLALFQVSSLALAVDESYQARALIKAVDRAVLSGELAAKVVKLPLRPGEAFSKGDLLVGLDCALYQAQSAKVSAEHKAAGLKLDNMRKLDQLRSVGALDVALAQAEQTKTAAALRIVRLNVSRCEIRAPYDGRVVTMMINRFENIRQQQELIEIVSDTNLEAEVVVPAPWLAWVKTGTSFALLIDDTTTRLQTEVSAVTPAIDAVSQTVLLRAKLPLDAGLIPGMSATAEFVPVPPE